MKRNAETGSWWRKLDMRIAQEIPGFMPDQRASVFLVVDKMTNLLNDDWGILNLQNFPYSVETGTAESRVGDASRYEIRLGVDYTF
ncbi:MAG: hypothetical protein WD071_03530 [Pseudohongiella sp.]|uniref:hypothetical protein n=1 Tax=Pseudohongiella sp. TaxID=1979412 RepID=UPI0034A00A59